MQKRLSEVETGQRKTILDMVSRRSGNVTYMSCLWLAATQTKPSAVTAQHGI